MAARSLNLGEFSEKHLPAKAWEDDRASNDFDLRDFFRVLRRRKLTMLIVFMAAVGAALLYLAITPSHYYASSSILIDPRLGRGFSIDPSQPNGGTTDASTIDSQVKLLTSQEVLARVIKSQNLEHDPEFGLKPPGFLAKLFGRAHDQTREDLTPVLKALDEAITIKRPERTYLVEIQVSSIDPVKAANIANAIARAYIDDQVENRIESASSDLKWVRDRMDTLQKQIQVAEDKVETYKSQNHIVTTEGLVSNEQQVSDLTKELGFARGRASEAKAKYDQIRRAARAKQLDAQSEALTSATIERLRTEQATSEREVARLANTLGARHPALMEAQAAAAKIKQLIGNELQRIEIGAADDYAAAHANEVQLEASIDQLKTQSNTTSMNLVPLRQLEREVDALRGSYERFAKIRDNLNEQEADSPPARIVTVAQPPISPSSPRKAIILFLGAGGGLFAAVAAALIQENLGGENSTPPEAPLPAGAPAPRKAFWKRRYLDETNDDPGETRW
jgi:polysaccharide biosynthesis transport protein